MRRRNSPTLACLSMALAIVACGGSSDEVLTPTGDVGPDYVAGVTAALIVPVFDIMSFILSLDDGALRKSVTEVVPCDPWPVCFGGSAEICYGEQPGEYDLAFYECVVEGSVFDGSTGLDPYVGGLIVSLDLDVDETAVLGSVNVVFSSQTCVQAVLDNLGTSTTTNWELSSNMSGTLTVCDNNDWPDGSLLANTHHVGVGDFRWQYQFDGTQIVDVLVYTGDGNALLNSCEVDMVSGSATCDAR